MPEQLAAIKDVVEDALRPILSATERGHGGPSDSPGTSGTTAAIGAPGTGAATGTSDAPGTSGASATPGESALPISSIYTVNTITTRPGASANRGISTHLVVPPSHPRGGEWRVRAVWRTGPRCYDNGRLGMAVVLAYIIIATPGQQARRHIQCSHSFSCPAGGLSTALGAVPPGGSLPDLPTFTPTEGSAGSSAGLGLLAAAAAAAAEPLAEKQLAGARRTSRHYTYPARTTRRPPYRRKSSRKYWHSNSLRWRSSVGIYGRRKQHLARPPGFLVAQLSRLSTA